MRLTLDLNAKSATRLENIRARTGAPSNSEVIREALRLYEYIVDKHETGHAFALVRNSETIEVELFDSHYSDRKQD